MPTVLTLDPFAEFFARIWALDLACPGCGNFHVEQARRSFQSVTKATRAARAVWDPLTSHFRCRSCGAHFVLGVVAWTPPFGDYHAPPADHLPKAWHLARIRELVGPGGLLMRPTVRLALRQEANLIVSRPCSCRAEPGGIVTRDPACAVHGKVRLHDDIRRGFVRRRAIRATWVHRPANGYAHLENRPRRPDGRFAKMTAWGASTGTLGAANAAPDLEIREKPGETNDKPE